MPKDFDRKLPKSGTVKAIYIFELEPKLYEIVGALHYPKSKKAIADGLGISPSTVNDAIEKSTCTPELLEQIWKALNAKGLRFSPPPHRATRDEKVWVEWRDPRATEHTPRKDREDTVEKFMGRFWQENPPQNAVSPPAPIVETESVASEARELTPTRATLPIKSVATPLIVADHGRHPPPAALPVSSAYADSDELCLHDLPVTVRSFNEVLGNVGLYLPAQRVYTGANGHISATVRCHAAELEGLKLAVTCCSLALERSPPNPRSHPPDRKIPVELTNAAGVTVTIQRTVAGRSPKVRVESSKGPIGEVELPAELWWLLEVNEGDELECEMHIFLRDCAVVITGAPIEDVAMEKIRKRFEERPLSADGSAILHTARVKLVAVPKPKG